MLLKVVSNSGSFQKKILFIFKSSVNNLRYSKVSLNQPTLFISGKTFTKKKLFLDIKCVGWENLKKLASHTGETLCQSFETSSGTITRITLSKTREIILRFLVHFWAFRFFLNRGLTCETSDSNFCDLLNELFHKNFFLKKNKMLKSYFEVPFSVFL